MDYLSNVTSLNQSQWFIWVKRSIATLNFVYNISSMTVSYKDIFTTLVGK